MAKLIDPITGNQMVGITKSGQVDTGSSPLLNQNALDKNVATPNKYYIDHQDKLDLINTLMGGTYAMRQAGKKYLPQESKESNENYENRLQRTVLFNGFGRTISYLTGQVFSKPVTLKEDVPTEIRGTKNTDGFVEDIDLRGNNSDAFLSKVFAKGITDGVTCILVDHPPKTSTVVTIADAKAKGVRPYWVHIPSSAIIGWKAERINGKEVFTQVRIQELFEKNDPKNTYDTITVRRIRVLYPGRFELYEETDKPNSKEVDWLLIEQGTTTTNVIPLAVFMPGERISTLTARPPLDDLAYLNLSHWQSTSDQNNILHFTRLPILFGKKITDQNQLSQIELGPNRMIHADSVEAELKYVEHQGASIAAGQANLIDLETKMALFGLQLLMPNTGNVTATERALSSGESDSTLRAWALEFNDFVEQCLVFTAMYVGKDKGGTSEVNTDFRWMQTMDAEVLLRGAQFSILPKQLVFEELRRRGIINADWEWQDMVDMFDKQNMMGAPMNINLPGVNVGKFTSTNTTPAKSPSGVGSPFGVKRGSGRKGGG
jgi:hypothetical protein